MKKHNIQSGLSHGITLKKKGVICSDGGGLLT